MIKVLPTKFVCQDMTVTSKRQSSDDINMSRAEVFVRKPRLVSHLSPCVQVFSWGRAASSAWQLKGLLPHLTSPLITISPLCSLYWTRPIRGFALLNTKSRSRTWARHRHIELWHIAKPSFFQRFRQNRNNVLTLLWSHNYIFSF